MNEHDLVRLKHMLDAAREAVGFMRGHSRGDLDQLRWLELTETRLIEIRSYVLEMYFSPGQGV